MNYLNIDSIGNRFATNLYINTNVSIDKEEHERKLALLPMIVDFSRLIDLEQSQRIPFQNSAAAPQTTSFRTLLHTVTSLFDKYLFDLSTDLIYNCICEKWARTIVLVQSVEDALLEAQSTTSKLGCLLESDFELNDDFLTVPQSDKSPLELVYGPKSDDEENIPNSRDPEINDIDEEETDDDEAIKYKLQTSGVKSFLDAVRTRKKYFAENTKISSDNIGVEHLVVAAATFVKVYCENGDKIQHLTMLAVRSPFQKLGLGHYLVNQIKQQSLIGPYDAIVVHADFNASEFFRKQDFSDDLLLISRWEEVADRFTDCTMMAYIPPFLGLHDTEGRDGTDFTKLHSELGKMQSTSRDAYQKQAQFIQGLTHEVARLSKTVCYQKSTIESLAKEVDKLRNEKLRIQKDFVQFKLFCESRHGNVSAMMPMLASNGEFDEEDDGDAELLLRQLTCGGAGRDEVDCLVATPQDATEVYGWGDSLELKENNSDSDVMPTNKGL